MKQATLPFLRNSIEDIVSDGLRGSKKNDLSRIVHKSSEIMMVDNCKGFAPRVLADDVMGQNVSSTLAILSEDTSNYIAFEDMSISETHSVLNKQLFEEQFLVEKVESKISESEMSVSEVVRSVETISQKSEYAYHTIGEASDLLGVPTHVLRFWEEKFSIIKPVKRNGGRRYYRPLDLERLKKIKELLYAQGYTIKGVQQLFKRKKTDHVVLDKEDSNLALKDQLLIMLDEVKALREFLKK